jgi:hypothetical protein
MKTKLSLSQLCPSATEAQLHALAHKLPVPPSPSWLVAHGHVPEGFDTLQAGELTKLPLVSCIMVVGGGNPKRIRLARAAVQRFIDQTYPEKQLVIVNCGSTPVLTQEYAPIREVLLKKPTSIGTMRNIGIGNADGAWIKQWDDDDLFDYNLLTYQMLHRRENVANFLSTQIRIDIVNGSGFLYHQPDGVPNTILCPRLHADYPDQDQYEDQAYARLWRERCEPHVVLNEFFPATCLNVAVYHGMNIMPPEYFTGSAQPGQIALPAREIRELKNIISRAGLSMDRKPVEVS